MSIFRKPSSSTTRRAMPISPIGSGRTLAPQRRLSTPSHCGCSGESTILCALPTGPSPTPSRQRMLRRRRMCSHLRRSWGFCGIAPKQSRPTAKRLPISCLDTISQHFGPAWQVFFEGWAKRSDGSEESRLTEMRRGLAINQEQGAVRFLPSLGAALAEAEASAGETDAGLQRLHDALAELEHPERWYEAEMHRIR